MNLHMAISVNEDTLIDFLLKGSLRSSNSLFRNAKFLLTRAEVEEV